MQIVLAGFEERNNAMIKDCIQNEMVQMKGLLQQITNNNGDIQPSTGIAVAHTVPTGNIVNTFYYDGKYYYVPKLFQFPSGINLHDAIHLSFSGMMVSTNGIEQVRPFRKLHMNTLPTRNLQNHFRTAWKPIFKYLDDNVDIDIDSVPTSNTINEYYDICIAVLETRVSYYFENGREKALLLSLSSWSKKNHFLMYQNTEKIIISKC